MSYTNLHLTQDDAEFKEKYKSVIDAVVQIEELGEVEVSFSTIQGMMTWRRKFYEYQKITGKSQYRAEARDAHTLLLRYRPKLPRGDHGLVGMGPPGSLVPVHTTDTKVIVSEADLELARRILEKVKKGETESDPIAILKEGADDRRPESGGDAADTGSSRGDD